MSLAPAIVNGQSQAPARTGASYVQPKTPWGEPDIQGIWNNVTGTPLQRTDEFKDKKNLTEQEAADFERRTAERQAKSEATPRNSCGVPQV